MPRKWKMRLKMIWRNYERPAPFGMFYDQRTGTLHVGGPLTAIDSMAELLLGAELVAGVPTGKRIGGRIRFKVDATMEQVGIFIEIAEAHGWEYQTVRCMRRLMQ